MKLCNPLKCITVLGFKKLDFRIFSADFEISIYSCHKFYHITSIISQFFNSRFRVHKKYQEASYTDKKWYIGY